MHVEVLLLCHQLEVVLSVILNLQHLSKKTVTACIQEVIRSQDPKRSHNPLLVGQPSLHLAEFFASYSSIEADREQQGADML